MVDIVITGHGRFASGIQSAVELLGGPNENLYYADFLESDTESDLMKKLEKIVERGRQSEILFFCDLIGGTPYKVSAQLSYFNEHYEVVAGCNIGSLLEVLFIKDRKSAKQLAQEIVSTSKKVTAMFEKKPVDNSYMKDIGSEDGI